MSGSHRRPSVTPHPARPKGRVRASRARCPRPGPAASGGLAISRGGVLVARLSVMPRSGDDIAYDLGLRMRDRRLRRGWSLLTLAEASGTSTSTLSRMELGLGGPVALATWAVVAAALDDDPFALEEPHAIGYDQSFEYLVAAAGWRPSGATDGYRTFERPPRPHRLPYSVVQRPAERFAVRVLRAVSDVDVETARLGAVVSRLIESGSAPVTSGVLVVIRTAATAQRLGGTAHRRSSPAWVRALRHEDSVMPDRLGLVWVSVSGSHLLPWSRRVA